MIGKNKLDVLAASCVTTGIGISLDLLSEMSLVALERKLKGDTQTKRLANLGFESPVNTKQ